MSNKILAIEKVVSILKTENAALKVENAILKSENATLKIENIELKDKLGLNSTNSSFPPSKDLYKVKDKERPKSTRKIGAQPGHKGTNRKLHNPDEIIHCYTPDFCECGGKIVVAKQPEVQQKIEIPPIKPHYTNYILHKGKCRCCNKRYSGVLPKGVNQDMLGNNAKTIITTLTGFFKNSKSEVQKILRDIFNLDLSIGTVSNTEKRVSEKCKATYEGYCADLKSSTYLHCDETGANKMGNKYWAWSFSSSSISVLKLESSRGKKVLKKMLENFKGTIISDRYAAYNFFEENQRQICWSHLIRDFKRFECSSNEDLKKIGRHLLAASSFIFKKFNHFKKDVIEATKDPPKQKEKVISLLYNRLIKALNPIRRFIRSRLEKVLSLNEAVIGAVRVAKKLLACEKMMWKFLQNIFVIEPTNNFAERQIRNFVIYRKNSFFVWSDRGEEFVERMHSIFMTSNLRKENPFQNLHKIIGG